MTVRCVPYTHPESQTLFSRNLSIDLGMPAVGEEVGVIAHRIEIENTGIGEAVISRMVDLSLGIVTSISTEASRMGQKFCFETTIPFRPGMSGGPIVKRPRPGDIVAACGIVSFDFSTEAAFSNFFEAGQSTASMLWPAMGLGLKVVRPGAAAPDFTFLADLVARGIIDNRSGGILVAVRPDPTGTEISYSDARVGSPIQIVLRTPAHPLAGLIAD